jgi:glycosyltransferase involved in cell wall biosynthesis
VDADRHDSASRPSVSVVVPFRGDSTAAARLLTALSRLRVDAGDELILADNTPECVARGLGSDRVRVVPAATERSSYHARNAGARGAANEWLLFLDADCAPEPDLLDAYFAAPIPAACGALSGTIEGDPSQEGLLARYARSRHFLSSTEGLLGPTATPTGNLLVRGRSFDAIGGFAPGIRSGGDLDLARRLAAAGWSIEHRPAAVVTHPHREDLPSFLGMIARYGAGARWLNERYPGSAPRWPLLTGLASTARDVAALGVRGRLEQALFRALDGAGLVAHNLGYMTSNSAPSIGK